MRTFRLRDLRPGWLFLFFWGLVAVLYAPAWRGGFDRDFHGWLEMYHDLSFGDMLNRKGTSVQSLYQLTQLQLYTWTSLFGHRPLPWHLLMTGLHAAVGAVGFSFLRRFFRDLGVPAAGGLALAGMVLALLSPSQTETVVWKASYHYPVACLGVLGLLRLAQAYLHTGRAQHAWTAAGLFALLTFTLEIWYAALPLTAILILAYHRAGVVAPPRVWATARAFLGPMLVLFGLHLLTFHAVFGHWMPHSDVGGARNAGPVYEPLGRGVSYVFHLLFFGRHFSFPLRHAVYEASRQPVVAWGTAALLLCLAALCVRWLRSRRPGGRAGAALFLMALPALVMILPFGLPDVLLVWNDRYLYFFSLFLYPLLALLVARAFRYRRGGWVALGLYATLGLGFMTYTVWQWRRAAKIFWGIQESFRWKAAEGPILLLNLPNYMNGAPIIYSNPVPKTPDRSNALFTDWSAENLHHHLRIFSGSGIRARVVDVAGYNMTTTWDGAHVTVLDSTRLRVTLNQWGTWWWDYILGATDYETDLYRMRFTDPGHEYEMELKRRPPGLIVLFSKGAQWYEVDWKKVGEEQWGEL